MQAVLTSGRSQFHLPPKAQEMVDALTKVLDASVVLYDGQNQKHHLAHDAGDWLSFQSTMEDSSLLCWVDAAINNRWTLYVCSRQPLHPDADALARWAAAKLALQLPVRAAEPPALPPISGEGVSTNGPEIGIPVWWTRKTPAN
jgi:hypothetical protein